MIFGGAVPLARVVHRRKLRSPSSQLSEYHRHRASGPGGHRYGGLRQDAKVFSSVADAEDVQVRHPALPSIIAVFLGILLAAACAPSLRAQAIDANSPLFSDSYDLTALGHEQAVMIKGSDARTTISFGVPVTKVVTQAKLEISYRASAALAPKSSTIDVSLNGTPVSSVPIADTSDPESVESAELELPAELLVADNTITFELKGKCTPGCLGGTPATLWLKLDRSTRIHLSGSVLAIARNLRLLPAPFLDGTSHRPVTAQMAFAETPDPHMLEASGIVPPGWELSPISEEFTFL